MKTWLAALIVAALSTAGAAVRADTPHLAKVDGRAELIVDGRPFPIFGGEVGNSSASSPAYMAQAWRKADVLGLNTLLVPVAWEQIEPREGQFDFSVPDQLIAQARGRRLHLVLLWFGSWKNSMSTYAPLWVRADTARFPRVELADNDPQEILSPYAPANREADAQAFAALMRHLRTTDAAGTVVMVQVENEVGVIPEARDFSPAADRAFRGAVPTELTSYLKAHLATLDPVLRAAWDRHGEPMAGTWTEVFGTGSATDELFAA